MAVPKGKISKARRDKRRNSHWKLSLPGMAKCPKFDLAQRRRFTVRRPAGSNARACARTDW